MTRILGIDPGSQRTGVGIIDIDATGKTIDTGKYLSVHKKSNGAWPYTRDVWNSDTAVPAPPPAQVQ